MGSGRETFTLDNDVRQLEIPFKRTPNSFELIADIQEWYRQNVNSDDDDDLRGITLLVKIPGSSNMVVANLALSLETEYLATNKVFSNLKYSAFYRGKKPSNYSISNGNLVFVYRENSFLPKGDWAVGAQNSRFFLNISVANLVVVGEYEEGDDVVVKMVWR